MTRAGVTGETRSNLYRSSLGGGIGETKDNETVLPRRVSMDTVNKEVEKVQRRVDRKELTREGLSEGDFRVMRGERNG